MTRPTESSRPDWANDIGHESHFVTIDGHQIHYLDEGEGPTILMLHGNPVWSYVYRDVIAGLAPGYRCIAPDLPGFGLSTAGAGYGFTPTEHIEVIEKLITSLDLTDSYLMANDWGGPIGLDVALRHPERFAGLIIGNTWAWPVRGAKNRLFPLIMGGPVGRFLNRRFNFFVRMTLKAGLKQHKLTNQERNAYFGPFQDRSARAAPTTFASSIVAESELLSSIEARLGELTDTPTLILWPDKDFAFGTDELDRWQQHLPHATTIHLENAGHYFQQDAPNETIAALRNWLDGRTTA